MRRSVIFASFFPPLVLLKYCELSYTYGEDIQRLGWRFIIILVVFWGRDLLHAWYIVVKVKKENWHRLAVCVKSGF